MKEKKSQESVKKSGKETKITAKYDCISGMCKRYTVGKLGDDISGAVYIKCSMKKVPKTITLIFSDVTEEGEDHENK